MDTSVRLGREPAVPAREIPGCIGNSLRKALRHETFSLVQAEAIRGPMAPLRDRADDALPPAPAAAPVHTRNMRQRAMLRRRGRDASIA